jgi:hypothetical protein
VLFRKINVYCKYHTKPTNTLADEVQSSLSLMQLVQAVTSVFRWMILSVAKKTMVIVLLYLTEGRGINSDNWHTRRKKYDDANTNEPTLQDKAMKIDYK